MKYQIEPIHPGRYWFTVFDDQNQIISRSDGGCAFIMLMLSRVIFEPEHAQYQRDQRASSDQLAEEALCKLIENTNAAFKKLEKKLLP